MFKRKDVIRSMFLLLLIITIMITLSQILVVHHHNHQDPKQRDMTRFRNMLRELEQSIDLMLKRDVLPLEKYVSAFQALIYSKRVAAIVQSGRPNSSITKQGRGDTDKVYSFRNDRKSRLLQNLEIQNQSSKLKRQSKQIAQDTYIMKMVVQGDKNLHSFVPTGTDRNSPIFERIIANEDSDLNYPNDELKEFRQKDSLKLRRTKRRTRLKIKDTFSRAQTQKSSRHKCPLIPSGLNGPLRIDLNVTEDEMAHIHHGDLKPGGIWQPRLCVSRHHVAIVIPYRDRLNHLRLLLHFLIPVLQRQQINFRIFVVEQFGNGTFNKGKLMNAAFKEAWKMADFDCFIFHDVDLIPEDDRNMYTCPTQPRHMSPAVDKFEYVLPYLQLVGGVFSIRREQFLRVNGYSNLYWGWGAEDDDMYLRMSTVGLKLTRPTVYVGRYKMIRHTQREVIPAKWRQYLLKTVKKRFHRDGLNSVDYNVTFIMDKPLFTHIMVDVGQPPTVVPNISAMMH